MFRINQIMIITAVLFVPLSGFSLSAKGLNDICEAEDAACKSYIAGFFDGYFLAPFNVNSFYGDINCMINKLDENPEANRDQLALDALADYVAKNEKAGGQKVPAALSIALAEKLGCKK